jgi:hypothetical protein
MQAQWERPILSFQKEDDDAGNISCAVNAFNRSTSNGNNDVRETGLETSKSIGISRGIGEFQEFRGNRVRFEWRESHQSDRLTTLRQMN